MQYPVGIVGASGYSGIEATRLLAAHPSVTLRFVTSDRWVGEAVGAHLPEVGGPAAALRYLANGEAEAAAAGCAAVLLATPAETSLELVPRLRKQSLRIIDLSGAFRLRDAALYPLFYGLTHSAPALLAEAAYGLPELFREGIRSAQLVANPGCFATCIALALAPLLKDGLLAEGALIADAASGVTGAGRKATEDFSFAEIADDFRAYRTLRHQHTPEIRQTLGATEPGGTLRPLTFTPHLLPLRRGILATIYARLGPKVSADAIHPAVSSFATRERFVTAHPSADAVSLRAVVGTNQLSVGASVDRDGADPGRVVVVAALDNLLKGAAGQAVQNLNLVLGLDEHAGLTQLRRFAP